MRRGRHLQRRPMHLEPVVKATLWFPRATAHSRSLALSHSIRLRLSDPSAVLIPLSPSAHPLPCSLPWNQQNPTSRHPVFVSFPRSWVLGPGEDAALSCPRLTCRGLRLPRSPVLLTCPRLSRVNQICASTPQSCRGLPPVNSLLFPNVPQRHLTKSRLIPGSDTVASAPAFHGN